jgi:hypothetical protein
MVRGQVAQDGRPSYLGEDDTCCASPSLPFSLLTQSAPAQELGPYRKGGSITRFKAVVDHYNTTGERFRISGECRSTCTMFLGIRNVCVEPSARLYFHAGHVTGDRQHMLGSATTAMLVQYNDALRSFVQSNGYITKPEFSVITGSDLIRKFGYPSCK